MSQKLVPLNEFHIPTATALDTLAAAAVLRIEAERPTAGSTEKHGAAEFLIKAALRELYAEFERRHGDQPAWIDMIALDLVIPLVSEAIKAAVKHFNTIGLFKGKPKQ